MSGKRHTDASVIPIFTQRTCTEPSCDGRCGRTHPNAPISAGDEGDAA